MDVKIGQKRPPLSDGWRLKISKSIKKLWENKEYIKQQKDSHLGHLVTNETKQKMRNSHMGKKSHFYKDGRCSSCGYLSWVKNRRNRLRGYQIKLGNTHTYNEWNNLKKKYNFICLSCQRMEPEIFLTEDHIIPLSKGGTDHIGNVQPLCLVCNIRKHDKVIDFKEVIGETS